MIGRIDAWEAAGLLDPATATRLRDAEADAPADTEVAEPAPPVAARALGITAAELFAYLGAAFVLAAWYALVSSTVPPGQDSSALYGWASVVAATALAVAGAAATRRDERFRRAAGVALLVSLPNLGAGVYLLAAEIHPETYPDAPTNAFVTSVIVLLAAFAIRRFLPALTTQLGLILSVATAAALTQAWLDATLFPRGANTYGPRPLDQTAAMVRVILSMAWWWVVATVMALLVVILDPTPRTEARTRLGRIAVGGTAVIGTATAVFIRYDWDSASGLAGEAVLAPWLGAGILLALSAVLVGLAVWRQSIGYLWPGGLGVFIALTYLNAEYLAAEGGLWVGLLVEAIVLFGVAIGVQRMGRRLRPARPGATSGQEAVKPDAVTPDA